MPGTPSDGLPSKASARFGDGESSNGHHGRAAASASGDAPLAPWRVVGSHYHGETATRVRVHMLENTAVRGEVKNRVLIILKLLRWMPCHSKRACTVPVWTWPAGRLVGALFCSSCIMDKSINQVLMLASDSTLARTRMQVQQLQEPPSPDDAVLAWMATLREDCPSPDTPDGEQLAQAVLQRRAAVSSTTIAVEEGQPISSVRAAALRIEGQLAGRGPPTPGDLSAHLVRFSVHGSTGTS